MRRTRVDMLTEVDLLTVKFLFPKIYLRPGSNYAKVFENAFESVRDAWACTKMVRETRISRE